MSESFERMSNALAGQYRIESRLGEGGMATVYVAEDLRHRRKVAVKVLRPELAAVVGAERFIQEITTTANLQHPHILPLFDSGEAEGFLYYVMPLIDGETLRDKLNREVQLGVEEALQTTWDVADALDYAHRHGVIHRDIKPENILLHDGRPLVADFGIALAVSAAGGTRLTKTGLSVGTPQYMSPEQASGARAIDGRSDVYSLGVVLYELLAGEPPHTGPTAQAVIAKVLTERAPSLHLRRDTVPPDVEVAVHRALERLPADRFARASDFAHALRETGTAQIGTVGDTVRNAPNKIGLRWLLVTVFVLGGAMGALVGSLQRGDDLDQAVTLFTTTLPAGQTFDLRRPGNPVAVSPNGRTLAYASHDGDSAVLFIRGLADPHARRIPESTGADAPLFSPDGTWVAFFANGQLKKVPTRGGRPQHIADVVGVGGVWIEGDTIIFGSATTDRGSGLWEVSANGGAPTQLTHTREFGPERGEQAHVFPQLLPGGQILYTSWYLPGDMRIAVWDRQTGEHKMLIEQGQYARWVSTGHLVYGWQSDLYAVAFDPVALEVKGRSVPIVENVSMQGRGRAGFAIAESGTFAYVPADRPPNETRFLWVDSGGVDTLATLPGEFFGPRVSPDGTQLAMMRADREVDLWLYELQRRSVRRLTDGAFAEFWPIWSADGGAVLHNSNRHGGMVLHVYRTQLDGGGPPERIFSGSYHQQPKALTGDGVLIYQESSNPITGLDVLQADLTRGAGPISLVQTEHNEAHASLSPDESLLAYASDRTGRYEVVVRPYPSLERRISVSTGGGVEPTWASNSATVYYRTLSGDSIMSVRVERTPELRAGPPQLVARGNFDEFYNAGRNYDLAPDGRFIVTEKQELPPANRFVVVLGWLAELEDRMAAVGRQ